MKYVLTTRIQMIYYFGEYESNFKRLLKRNWLNEADIVKVSNEFEKIKMKYSKLEEQFSYNEAVELITQMKKMPVDTFWVKKEKFLARFEEWKQT